jgi:paraquat-inducible protein A
LRETRALACGACGSELERRTGRSLDATLALSAAALLILIPANLETFLTTSALGAVRTSRLVSGPAELWREGWPVLGILIGLLVVVAPILRFGLLTAVLTAVRLRWRGRWIGPAFRWTNRLQSWAMADIALVGLWVAYTRLSATVPTRLGVGGMCLIAAGVLCLFARATLNPSEVWRRIRRQPPVDAARPILSCDGCGYLAPQRSASRPCPRCGQRLHIRKPGAARRAAAFTIAGLLLYLPANLFPMATVPINLVPTSYTVLAGARGLFTAGFWGLGLLVLTASFAVPLLKLGALGWFLAAPAGGGAPILKTRLFGVVEEIGRWSMVDPLVLALFVPVMQFNTQLSGRAEPAATAFAAVVVTTMVATRAFDPRLLWDAARRSL